MPKITKQEKTKPSRTTKAKQDINHLPLEHLLGEVLVNKLEIVGLFHY